MATKTGTSLAEVLNSNAASDRLLGLGGADTLNGGGGNDTLDGGTGIDKLTGGTGNDVYIFAAGGGTDQIFEAAAGGGTDTLRSGITVTLATNVENLVLTGTSNLNGTGNTSHNKITGNNGNNRLSGVSGNDTLDGGAGNDTTTGGSGNDVHIVAQAGDKVVESATNGGTDLVRSSVTHTLAPNVENLTLTGSNAINGTGNTSANTLTGNTKNNKLSGLDGNDKLSGGNGADTLIGGNGKDSLSGGSGNDSLDGGAGSADTLLGGAGNDTLIWDAADTVRDGGDNTDTLRVTADGAVNLAAEPIASMEIVHLAGNNTLTVAPADILTRFTNNTLTVNGGDGDAVIAGSGWTQLANDGGYAVYEKDGATLKVDLDIDRDGIGIVAMSLGASGSRLDGIDANDDSGVSVASAGDVNGDGYADVIIGASSAANSAGESYVVFGAATGIGAVLALSSLDGTNGFRLEGIDAVDYSGVSVASAGDVNDDGYADLIIGARGANGGAGETYVVFGKASGFGLSLGLGSLDGTNGFRLDGVGGDLSGKSVASAGDVNGDGYADLVIGARYANGGAGSTYVVFGGAAGFGPSVDLGALDGTSGFRVDGIDSGDLSGASVASAGDLNRDGFDDLIIGAFNAEAAAGGDDNTGETYVVFGKASGFAPSLSVSALNGANGFRLDGIDFDDRSGHSVASAGDVNGDGYDDLVIGAQYADPGGDERAGESYVVFGRSAFASSMSLASLDGTTGFRIDGVDANSSSGYSVASAGDVNGDGYDDLLVGAFLANIGEDTSAGATFLVFGKSAFGAAVDLASLDGTDGIRLDGIDPLDFSGYSVAAAGDVNGDGYGDLIVGAKGADGYAGESYIVYGRDFNGAAGNVGSFEADTLVGGAVLRGGAGDDYLAIADGTFLDVDGGSGRDTAALGGGDEYDLRELGSKLAGIEVVDLTAPGTETLTLDAVSLLDLSDTSNTLRVTGTAEDNLTAGAGWSFDRFIEDGAYIRYTQGAAVLEVASGLNHDLGYTVHLSGLDGVGGFRLNGEAADDSSGTAVSGAGDLNQDGLDDFIIGATGASTAYVVFGTGESSAPSFDLADLDGTNGFRLAGLDGDGVARSVSAAGDLNGDGVGDLVVGAPSADVDGETSAGTAYVVFGSATGYAPGIELSALDGANGFRLLGLDEYDATGISVSAAGDVNGDGYADLIVGADRAYGYAGLSFVLLGGAGGFASEIDLADVDGGDAGFRIIGETAFIHSGASVARAGDVNGDGVDDLIVGAYSYGAGFTNIGAAYVVYGQPGGPGGNVDLGDLGSAAFRLTGVAAGDKAGNSVAGAGDLNGDGYADLIVGAVGTSAYQGSAYVVFGRSDMGTGLDLSALDGTNGFRVDGAVASDRLGQSVASADLNGDGYDDLIVGVPGSDAGGDYAGEVYVIFGRGDAFAPAISATDLDGISGFRLQGFGGDAGAGGSVASAGDVNGDGYADLLIGAAGANDYAGASYIYFGRDFTGAVDVEGTDGDDSISGSSGAAIVVGGLGDDDIVSGGGADVLKGGAGNDTFHIHPDNLARVFGGSGTDTLRVSEPGQDLDLTLLPDSRFAGIEAIDLTGSGANLLTLSQGDLFALSGESNTLRVDGDAGIDGVTVVGAPGTGLWTRGETIDLYDVYTKGAATLMVHVDVDRDIDAYVSEIELSSLDGTSGFAIRGEDPNDLAGTAVSGAGDVDGDGFADFLVGATGVEADHPYDANRGAAYLVFGSSTGLGASLSVTALDGTNGFVMFGQNGGGFATPDRLGFSVSAAGDMNGDGLADFILGAPGADPHGTDSGTAYVVFGAADFAAGGDQYELDQPGTRGFWILGEDTGDGAGFSVSGAGDLNGDGYDDLVVGAPSQLHGGAAVILGRADGFASRLELSALDGTNGFRISGGEDNGFLGVSVSAAGDVNADGYGDLIVGDHEAAPGAEAGSASYVVFGSSSGFASGIEVSALDGATGFRISGAPGSDSGVSVSEAGDVNADGIGDLIVGDMAAGRAYVVYGTGAGFASSLDLTALDGTVGFVLAGAEGEGTGSVSAAGDVNGDGIDDLIVGASSAAPYSTGAAYVVFGRADFAALLEEGIFHLDEVDGVTGLKLLGAGFSERAGTSVSSAGDVNGDGFDDLLVGAPGFDPAGLPGTAHVVYGRDFRNEVDFTGTGAGDALSGTAAAEIFVGGRGDDTMTGNGGADVFRGGAGNDRIVVGSSSFADVDGGAGTDTLAIAGGVSLNLGGLAGTAVSGIEAVDLAAAGANSLTLTALDVLNLSDTSNTLRVSGSAEDMLSGGAGWTFDGYIEGGAYARYHQGAAMLEVASGLSHDLGHVIYLSGLNGINGFRLDGLADGDLSGRRLAGAGDVNGDGLDDAVIGAQNASGTGDAYVVFGAASGFDASQRIDEVDGIRLDGVANGNATGFAVSSAGDANGDGIGDVIVSARLANGGAGATFVVFGKTDLGDALFLSSLDGTSGYRLDGIETTDFTGQAVASGDFNSDGYDDLVVSSFQANSAAGATYVIFGGAEAPGASLPLSDLDGTNGFRLDGIVAGDYSGWSVASAGDFDGDGIDDLIIGAFAADSGAGESYVVYGQAGPWSSSLALSALNGTNGFRLDGIDGGDRSGRSVSSAGDFNGDGRDDLLIAAPRANGFNGETYVVFGSTGLGSSFSLSGLDGTNGFRVDAASNNSDYTGQSIASAGDVNGDGYDDLIIGATSAELGRGAYYVVFGAADAPGSSLALSNLDGTNGFKLVGVGSQTGFAVDSAGDVNGDGYDDLIVSAYQAAAFAGQTFVVYGRDFNAVVDFEGAAGSDSLDDGTSAAEVFVAGGGDDTILGGGGADVMNGGAGDDELYITADTFRVDGGSGEDTLKLGLLNAALDLTAISDHRFTGIEVIDLTGNGGERLTLSAGDILALSGTSNTLRVMGDSGSVFVTSEAGTALWMRGDDLADDGQTYAVYTRGAATLEVDLDVGTDGIPAYFRSVVALSGLNGANGIRLEGIDAGDYAGRSVASAGDVNGDGYDDLIIGAHFANDLKGESYVVFGGALAATVSLSGLNGASGFRLDGFTGRAGYSVASAGDVNGDGLADLIVGALYADSSAGEAYVVFGSTAFSASFAFSSLDGANGFRLDGVDGILPSGGRAGSSVAAAGDVNGDGYADVIVGAPGTNVSENESYVVFGGSSFASAVSLSSLDGTTGFRLDGINTGDRSGVSVAGAGDVNGDGYADLVIGADGAESAYNGTGETYVIFGQAGFASAIALSSLDGTAGFRLDGTLPNLSASGRRVASAGDVNGDGLADVIIGHHKANPNGSYSGSTYVVFGATSFTASAMSLGALDGTDGFRLDGNTAGGKSGGAVASAGDFNGDGYDDVIIGEYGPDPSGTGAAYVVFGGSSFASAMSLNALDGTTGFRLSGVGAGDRAGFSVAAAGDVNGDGFDDLVIGAPRGNPGSPARADAGESYIVYGGAVTNEVMRLGGNGADGLAGTAAAESFVAGGGDDTIAGGGGADVLRGGEGDDRIVLGDLAAFDIDGGGGQDALAVTGDMDIDLTGFAVSTLQGIEAVDLVAGAGSNTLTLTLHDLLNLSATSNTLTVDGDAQDTLDLAGAWVLQTTDSGYETWTLGAATLRVDVDVIFIE